MVLIKVSVEQTINCRLGFCLKKESMLIYTAYRAWQFVIAWQLTKVTSIAND